PRVLTFVKQLESKLLVEFDGTSHVTDGEGDCADMTDHPSWPPVAPAIGIIPAEVGMRFEAFSFGSIRIDGVTHEHDVLVDRGQVHKRKKKPSKKFRDAFAHTPLSIEEEIPWKCRRLVIGTGTGALPVMEEVKQEAKRRRIQLLVLPTVQAIQVLQENPDGVNAILHVTC